MADADDVRRLALALDVVEIDSDGFDFRVADKGFVWSYPERLPGRPRVIRTDIAVLYVGDEAEKQALLLGEPDIFFTTPAYDGLPLVMLRLARVDVERLGELVTDAWRMRGGDSLTVGVIRPGKVRRRRRRTTWAGGRAVLLIFADPRHVAVRSQQHCGHVEFVAGVDDVVDPVRPAGHREPAGLVEQQAAAGVHQFVEAAPLQLDVPQPPAEEFVALAEVVADADRDDLLDQVAVHLFEVHQLREQSPHCLGAGLGGHQFDLRAGVVQYVGGHRVPFGVVAVQQVLRRPAVDLGGQFPAEVERVLDAEVEPLAAGRRVDVRGVAGQQDPADR